MSKKQKNFNYLREEDQYRIILYTLSGKINLQTVYEEYGISEEEFYQLKDKLLKRSFGEPGNQTGSSANNKLT